MASTFRMADIGLASSSSVAEVVRCAQVAEAEGYDTFWIAELYYARGLVTLAAAVAAATKRIKIGFGIISPFSRHPGVIAMETATLDEMSGGRMIVGMGIAQMACTRQGVEDPKPAVSLRDGVAIVRSMLRGETTVHDGPFFKMTAPGSPLRLDLVRKDVPIYLGAMGPKSLELAGKIADGVLFGMFSTPGLIKWANGQIDKGLAAAGRTRKDFTTRSYITFSVDSDAKKAKDATRPLLTAYLSEGVSTSATNAGSPRWKYSGVPDDELLAVKGEIAKYMSRGEIKKAQESIPVPFIDRMIVAGTPDECAERVKLYAEAGLDVPVPYAVLGPDPAKAIPIIRKILPLG